MKRWILLVISLLHIPLYSSSQPLVDKCGYHYIHTHAAQLIPDITQQLLEQQHISAKTTGNNLATVTVPVVFHIVLNNTNLAKLGDSITIASRIHTQIDVLNEDYNRANKDSTKIPAVFKSLYGNVNIQFALAHTDPSGNATKGWEIVPTSVSGFEISTSNPGNDAKHNATKGADAWDVTKYINVWVINTSPDNILGITIPPSFTRYPYNLYQPEEMGILLNYGVLGRRSTTTEYFFNGTEYDQGRTLTHETGHYFELLHPWGDDDDDGTCRCPTDLGGHDDGIDDTPPEGCRHLGCYNFPFFDLCSPPGTVSSPSGTNGIMFMNYMDYTNDTCMYMFTKQQALVMNSQILPSGESYELTRYPELLQYPGNVAPTSDVYVVGPNPTDGVFYVQFEEVPAHLESVKVYNIIGQMIKEVPTDGKQNTIYPVDMSVMSKGLYFAEILFSNHRDVIKITLR
jgi:Pregnancy-associated plasma protein-A/Secretion system C-terminal sorting domain